MVREGMRRGTSLRARARGLAAQACDEGRDRAAAGRGSAAIVLESMQSRHEEETVQKTRAGADDQQEIDTLVEGFPEYYRLSTHLALLVGGLRIGEVCGLQLRDIDLDHRLLYVRHSVTQGPDDLGEYRLDETKTPESHRVVPIPAPVCRLIREHIDRFCPDRDPDTMLFHAIRHPERVLNPTTIQRQFRTARKRINREDVTFHSLRATHATMFMIQGGTLRETMDELGHVDVDVAVRCYQRVVPRHRRDVAERLALEYLPAGDPAGIKAQIAQKEEEIDQLRQTLAGLRRRLEELEDDGDGRSQSG